MRRAENWDLNGAPARDDPGLTHPREERSLPADMQRSHHAGPFIVAFAGVFACGSQNSSHEGATADAGSEATPTGNDASAASDAPFDVVVSDATGGDAGLPAIDASAPVNALTDAQKGALCDWLSAELGGYGVSTDCGHGTSVANAMSQAQCISTRLTFRCTITVGQLETCIEAEAPSLGCNFPMPQCTPLLC